jgi:hypothetical protein
MEIGISEIIIIAVVVYYIYLIDRFYVGKGKNRFPGSAGMGSTGKKPERESAEEQDPYRILDVDQHATKDELAAAYRKIAKMYHPDMVAGLAPEYREIAEKKMKIINAAYRKAKDAVER